MLDGNVVVVTGGAGLLGRQFCISIAKNGGIPIVADLDLVAANNIVREIESENGQAHAVRLDITAPDSVRKMIEDVHAHYGHMNALVNSAYPRNINYGLRLEDVSYADFCENVGIHLGGYFLVAQQCALYFRQHGGGNIVNMASIYGAMAPRFEVYAGSSMTMPVEYAAIKSAVIQLTKYFAKYFLKDGIRCNALSPGGILDQQPDSFTSSYNKHCGAKGMLDPRDVVATLLYLLSDDSKYMTGQNLIIDDGFCL